MQDLHCRDRADLSAMNHWRIHRRRTLYAFAIGIAGYAVGLLLSAWLDLPSGATVVWALAICGAGVMFWKRL